MSISLYVYQISEIKLIDLILPFTDLIYIKTNYILHMLYNYYFIEKTNKTLRIIYFVL